MFCSFKVCDTLKYLLPESTSLGAKAELVRGAGFVKGVVRRLEFGLMGVEQLISCSIRDVGSRQQNRHFVLSPPRGTVADQLIR